MTRYKTIEFSLKFEVHIQLLTPYGYMWILTIQLLVKKKKTDFDNFTTCSNDLVET